MTLCSLYVLIIMPLLCPIICPYMSLYALTFHIFILHVLFLFILETSAGRDPARDFAGSRSRNPALFSICGILRDAGFFPIFLKNPACGIPQTRFCRSLVYISVLLVFIINVHLFFLIFFNIYIHMLQQSVPFH